MIKLFIRSLGTHTYIILRKWTSESCISVLCDIFKSHSEVTNILTKSAYTADHMCHTHMTHRIITIGEHNTAVAYILIRF